MNIDTCDKREHKRPTTPFGFIVFSKDGKVRSEITTLPDTKDAQEIELGRLFVQALYERYGRLLVDLKQLDERGHDLHAREANSSIEIQVAEARLESLSEVDCTHPDVVVIVPRPGRQLCVKRHDYWSIVAAAIEGKIKKHYAKLQSSRLFLVVVDMSGSSIFLRPEVLQTAKEALLREKHSFDEVWCMSPTTPPCPSFLEQLWPASTSQSRSD